MRNLLVVLSLAVLACVASPPAPHAAESKICEQLWYNRTAILARRGKCFQDQRALEVFGQRCFPPYGKLPFRDQRRVDNIRRQERRNGCAS